MKQELKSENVKINLKLKDQMKRANEFKLKFDEQNKIIEGKVNNSNIFEIFILIFSF